MNWSKGNAFQQPLDWGDLKGRPVTSQSNFADSPIFTQAPRAEIHQLWRAFEPLPFALRKSVLRFGDVTCATRGSYFVPDREVAVVLSGCLVLHVGETDICADVATAGMLVSLQGGPKGRWMSDGFLYTVRLEDFTRETGEVGIRFLLSASVERLRARERRLACAATHAVLPRVASLFGELSSTCETSDVRVNQAEVGAMLGLRRSSVNLACQTMTRLRAIRTIRGRVSIVDRSLLASIACCPSSARTTTEETYAAPRVTLKHSH